MKFSALAALEVAKMTTSTAADDENPAFKWRYFRSVCPLTKGL